MRALAPIPPPTEVEMDRFLGHVYESFHYDFRNYAMASLTRRLVAAMSGFGCKSLQALSEKIDADPAIFTRLIGFLTVQVSEMFRDPSYFKTFREEIVPELRTYPFVKIWVAGCSAGEEAYSFAIILKEEGLLDRTLIYATDVNAQALAKAETGVYAADRLQTFSENHRQTGARRALSEHFTAGATAAVFDRAFKSHLVFSDHSLSTDNVFAEVQLISCRNVLIYFDHVLQDRAIGLFRDALCRRGFLGIGAKESLQFSPHGPAFTAYAEEGRWYRRI
jgi:chemotaxis protein methyltransferase CheR